MSMAQAPASTAPTSRLAGIDFLRGVAVLLVVVHHIHLRFRLNRFDVSGVLPQGLERTLFSSGYYAVIAFFVISGFLITRLSLRRWGSLSKVSLGGFYTMRVARIMPCLLLLLVVLTALHCAGASDFTIRPERASLGRALLAALTFHVNWLEGHAGYLPGNWDVLWSLSVEEVFYLAFPLVCLLLRRESWLIAALSALIVAGPINRALLDGQDPWQSYAYLSCTDAIAFGCLTALVVARVTLRKVMLQAALSMGVILSAFILICRETVLSLGLFRLGLDVTLLELAVAAMIVALANGVGSDALRKGTQLIRTIGRSSYEIYLTHMFVVFGLMQIVKGTHSPNAAIPAWYVGMLVLSVLLGCAVAQLYSEPVNVAIRAWFGKRARGPEPIPAPVT